MGKTEFLKDDYFLKQIDNLSVKEQYLRLTILDWNEEPLNEIQGKAISGSLNIDGKSSLRRTANFTMFAEEDKNDLTAINQELSINRKVRLEIGVLNTVPKYNYEFFNDKIQKNDFAVIDYQQKYGEIVWFPLGIFIIFDPNISHQLSGVTISITLKDKMCLLNGDAGGVIPATVNFSQREDEYGVITVPTIRQTIYQLVNHFGLENASKIIIDDLQDRIKQVVQYIGSEPIYLGKKENQSNLYVTWEDARQAGYSEDEIITIQYGMDMGYVMTDFTYPGVLECGGGDFVSSVLDKIIAALGNYEYFYDVNGYFHFQQIKNYLNITQATYKLRRYTASIDGKIDGQGNIDKTINTQYDLDLTTGKSVYTFEDGQLITAITNAPRYSNIKNDFVVWGTRKNSLGIEVPIRYHLAIDKKPEIGQIHYARLIQDDNGDWRAAQDFFFLASSGGSDPTAAANLQDYYINTSTYFLFKYDRIYDENGNWVRNGWVKQQPPKTNTIWQITEEGNIKTAYYYNDNIDNTLTKITDQSFIHETVDWREQLYYQGVQALATGTDYPYYFTQLLNEWPKLFNLKEQKFKDSVTNNIKNNLEQIDAYNNSGQIDYWLDFIEQTSAVGQYSVNNIGRRSMIVSEDELNCIFENKPPEVVYINTANSQQAAKERKECMNNGYLPCQISSDKYSLLAVGGTQNSCYQRITELLYQYTNMNESVQISAIPIFYLEPNTRITIRDDASGVIGDYMIDSISLPLDINSVMSLNCYKCLTKI